MENNKKLVDNIFTGPGSAYQVFEQYKQGEYNESGQKPQFINPDKSEKKNKVILN